MQSVYLQWIMKIYAIGHLVKTNPIKANFKPDTCDALRSSNAASHLLIKPILLLYKPGNDRYYTRRYCRCSSMEEHSFRKAEVEGSTPSIGCFVKMRAYLLRESAYGNSN